ncbi:hypothetical protein EVG20_g6234 [Dentipellis fragilis]|uniref:Uncharacterized protein n=1 Tax=Dentipellis fragilis TaxID=205917 RepID=A0A4Y9YM30_9AGAM|nr:hypothetical protein EVG20_g6234 [Dentipellis fragilis]
MSAPSSSNTSLPLTGGLPTTSQDIAPSAIFIGLYLLTGALCLFRMLAQYRTPRSILLTYVRLMVFEIVRVVTFIVRILGAENYSAALKGTAQFNETLLIVEQILISVGYLMPAAVLVKLVGFHSARAESEGRSRIVIRVLELAIMGAMTISSIVVIAVLALIVVFCISLARRKGIPQRTTLWLGLSSAILTIVPIYRIANSANPPADSNSNSAKLAFYVFQLAIEWLVGAALLAVNAKEWCGVEDERSQTMPVYVAGPAYAQSEEEMRKPFAYGSGGY